LDLYDGVKEQSASFGQPLLDGECVDAIVFSDSVSPVIINECRDMGMPAFIATRGIAQARLSGLDTYYVCEAGERMSQTPVGVIKPVQPNIFEKHANREEKPTAEVWSHTTSSVDPHISTERTTPSGAQRGSIEQQQRSGKRPGGEECQLLPASCRVAKMMRPVASIWAKMLQQRQAALLGSSLDPKCLAKFTSDEGIVTYQKPPQGGVVVLGCGNSYGGLALSKFFAWSSGNYASIDAAPVRDKRVLEFGAGTGLIGLTLGRLGANVTMTDYELDTLLLMQHNINANKLSSVVAVQFLEWGDESTYLVEDTFDVIVAGESLYDAYAGEGNAMLLAHAFKAHIKEGSGTVAYLAYRHRSENPLRFFSALMIEGFHVERLENESGQAVGCSLGPTNSFDGSRFVPLAPDVCLHAIRRPVFAPDNHKETQIIRMSRAESNLTEHVGLDEELHSSVVGQPA